MQSLCASLKPIWSGLKLEHTKLLEKASHMPISRRSSQPRSKIQVRPRSDLAQLMFIYSISIYPSINYVCSYFSKKKKTMFVLVIKFLLLFFLFFFWRKHHFGPYILGSQSIQFLHFGNSQFGPCYFQFAVNLIPTVNSLTKNVYVANGLHC